MAGKEAPKKAEAKEKKTSKSSLYTASGTDLKRNKRFCPKCGPGVFLAQHDNRSSCGNCGYLEWKAKA